MLSVTLLYLMVVNFDQFHNMICGVFRQYPVLIPALRYFLSLVFPVTGYKWHVPYASCLALSCNFRSSGLCGLPSMLALSVVNLNIDIYDLTISIVNVSLLKCYTSVCQVNQRSDSELARLQQVDEGQWLSGGGGNYPHGIA